ncbi:Protein CBG07161 [Caenorhabditis briggsae]|uniref:Protein CBG07161 n=1 Tax=Caenorhabditis briggsae TaxID=6238 RepID=A8X3K7_CAEBR|nr:Protein CBG07161 [Caenorhabditis briggsae]CAP27217.1 Protein CBG07161 [Caenorhabditis briggsae]
MPSLFTLLLIGCCFASTLAEVTCPDGFTLINGRKCVQISYGTGPHADIAKECKSVGARLVTIKNQEDNDAIYDFAKKSSCYSYWIGVSCLSINGNTTCYNDDYSGPVTYNNWAPSHPRISTDKYKFSLSVYAESSWNFALPWKTVDGSSIAYQGICEVPTTFADPSCKYNYNGYCYIPSHEIPGVTTNSTTYPKAQAICRSLNANIVSIHSKLENDYIKSIYKDSGVYQITLGAQAFQPHVFNWVDGSSFDFSYRSPFDNFTGNCLQMDTLDGLWTEVNCQVFNNFLCQRKIGGRSENLRIVPSHIDLSDSSGCDNTIVLAPGTVTSFGYGTSPLPVANCLWRVAALGSDQVAIYFTEMEIGNWLYVETQPGKPDRKFNGSMDEARYVAPGNTAMIVHYSDRDTNLKGFKGVVMAY